MSTPPSSPHILPTVSFTSIALMLLGAFGAAAIWVMVAFGFGMWSSALAFIATADLVLLLRLVRLRRGFWRGGQAALGTALAILLAQWWTLATMVGIQLGMMPWESIPKMGAGFALTLSQMSLQPMDPLIYASAVTLAWVLGR